MSGIAILGAGAFGTALAVALAQGGRQVTLWGRDAVTMAAIEASRQSPHLPDVVLPDGLVVTGTLPDLAGADSVLLAVPMQALAGFLRDTALPARDFVACCKGADLETGLGPVATISAALPGDHAILTGPSFAADIARGLPTALTLACADEAQAELLQALLSTPSLRVYRTGDVTGAELGGALKNVMAIAAGVVIGAGLGDSARAALMTRGYAEMLRFALSQGAQGDTLAGLSGLGDLILTCTSAQSRNFRFGQALAKGTVFDPKTTVEGAATARAVAIRAAAMGIDMPITTMVAALVAGRASVPEAIRNLLNRPLKTE